VEKEKNVMALLQRKRTMRMEHDKKKVEDQLSEAIEKHQQEEQEKSLRQMRAVKKQ